MLSPDFKIYYLGGRTYVGAIENAPTNFVLLIIVPDKEHGRRIISGGDVYIYNDANGRWSATDLLGFTQEIQLPGLYRIFLGVMAGSDEWNAAMRDARNDPEFPTQTALHYYERKEGFE